MSLGGGAFLAHNKVAPGVYMNFVSAARASASISERGAAALALELDWGPDGEVFRVEGAQMQKESKKIFGYDYSHPRLKGLRDLFLHARVLYAYRLNSGKKAENIYALARYSGIRGNDLKIVVEKKMPDGNLFEVQTLLDNQVVDVQTAAVMSDLKENDYVSFKPEAVLEASAGIPLAGGTNTLQVTGDRYQQFLDKIEAYRFQTLGCLSREENIKKLFIAFTRRMRDEVGVKFQTVVWNQPADYEGVINVKNSVKDEGNTADLVYWAAGIHAGCEMNASNVNRVYDGEFTVQADYTQFQLEEAVQAGEFVLHRVGQEIRVFMDINSFTSVSVNKNKDFQSNQIIRVLDQIGNDVASLFNRRYLGMVQNNASGRMAFWNDIVSYNRQLEKLGAIENFMPEDLIVEAGEDKSSVVVSNPVTPVMAMEKLYMTIVVR